MIAKKLKIIGPYTPDHPGPFCTRDGRSVRIICTDRKGLYPIVALVAESDVEEVTMLFCANGRDKEASDFICDDDLMNAEEVPVAREFWVVGSNLYTSREESEIYCTGIYAITAGRRDIIHLREVLPGDEK